MFSFGLRKKARTAVCGDGSQMLFRPPERLLAPALAVSQGDQTLDDHRLVSRIVSAYRATHSEMPKGSMWSDHFGGIKADVHQRLIDGSLEEIAAMLRDPATNHLLYGFDSIHTGSADEFGSGLGRPHYDLLVRLGEGLGAIRAYNFEAVYPSRWEPESANTIVAAIEKRVGRQLQFPNPYPGEIGLPSTRGVIGWRPLQAIFQAHLIERMLPAHGARRVVEIGAGLGRNAFYAARAGIKDYTIVDLPLTNVAQAYFLGRVLGEDRVCLFNEEPRDGAVRILPPSVFFEERGRSFDLALNADSFVELSRDVATGYIVSLSQRCPVLLSINHEFNGFTVAEICAEHPNWRVDRDAYWMRKGYVQETIRF